MPTAIRARETDGNSSHGRRSFQPATEFRRTKSYNNGSQSRVAQKPTPPETTHAENFYYLKQMNSKTPMVIVMTDGEEIRGCIEWYDRTSLKVNRDGAPNLLIQKHWIKYVFKQDEL